MRTLLLLLFVTNASALVAGLSPNETRLIFYYGPGFSDSATYELTEAAKVLEHPNFVNNETHIFLHGWNENQTSESVVVTVEAYYKRNTINLLVLDWGAAACQPLNDSILLIPMVGSQLADMLLDLSAAGLDWDSITVVTYSLGPQLGGVAGREVMRKTNGTEQLYQMILLDPAFPLFPIVPLPSVDKNDAQFVQVIHTDSGAYGQPFQLCHVDFWPNAAQQGQPGCPKGDFLPFTEEAICSHHRSYRLWAESIAAVEGPYFWAFPAASYEAFVEADVDNLKDEAIQMGFNCPRGASGNYYLTTNSESPYARGFDGY